MIQNSSVPLAWSLVFQKSGTNHHYSVNCTCSSCSLSNLRGTTDICPEWENCSNCSNHEMKERFLLNSSYRWFKHWPFFSSFRKFYLLHSEIMYFFFLKRTQKDKNWNFSVTCPGCTSVCLSTFKCSWGQECTCHYRQGIPFRRSTGGLQGHQKIPPRILHYLVCSAVMVHILFPLLPLTKALASIHFWHCILFSYSDHELSKCKHGNNVC